MTRDMRHTLLVDAVIVVALVALALILSPGWAIVGIAALLALILCAISFLFTALRSRRRRKRTAARRRGATGGQPGYARPRTAAGERATYSAPRASERPGAPPTRRVAPSRSTESRRKPLR